MTRQRTLLFAFALVLSACGGGSKYMREQQPPQAIRAVPGTATVVFLRPSKLGRKVGFRIVDGQGRFLTALYGREYSILSIEPGRHEFIVHAENNDMMEAELQANRVYYVLVGTRMGAFKARSSISALTPRREEWRSLAEYIEDSTQMVPDTALAQSALNPAGIQAWIAEARANYAGYDAEERAIRFLAASDGIDGGLL